MLAACSRPPEKGRFAVLTFENLTGDSSQDWIANAAPSIMAAELGGARGSSVGDAYIQNATQIVHGYFTNRGFEISVEDTARHKLSEPRQYRGELLAAMNMAAKAIAPSARAFSTTREDAAEAWGRSEFEKAVAIDGDFGAAWLAWVEASIQHGDAQQAASIADRALERPSLRSDLDRARIELLAANLHGDSDARARAFAQIAKLTKEPTAIAAYAEAELKVHDFESAIAAFQELLVQTPDNAAAMLTLGYTQAYAGQLEAAIATLEKYGKLPAQRTNSLDSIGEAYFMNGRFPEAEKFFLAAQQSNPQFGNSSMEFLKAAYAHWLAGDLKGADALASKSLRDPWHEACWLFATGREKEAVAKLQSAPDKKIVEHQMAIWNATLPSDVSKLKALYERTPPSSDGQARVFYAAALAKAGQKEEARKLIGRWPLPIEQNVDQFSESLVFPNFLQVRQSTDHGPLAR
jgi:tetratricopeptide (TPR) repeat protein